MINYLGLTASTLGILFIIISFYITNLIISKYIKNHIFSLHRFHFYLIISFLILFLIIRIYAIFYADNLTNLGLPEEVLIEKILYIRMLIHIPLAISVSLFLFLCYGCLYEMKIKLKS